MEEKGIIEGLLGAVYKSNDDKTECWSLCHHISYLLGTSLPPSIWAMRRVGVSPILKSIVLFKFPGEPWHTGVIWPDCVHFVHTVKRLDLYYVKKERLNQQVLPFVKGYYVVRDE